MVLANFNYLNLNECMKCFVVCHVKSLAVMCCLVLIKTDEVAELYIDRYEHML